MIIGHRGAAGHRPEHTAGSYEAAAALGADWLEIDLVSTKDHALVIRHENEIGLTTDVAQHPEFADRRTTKTIDGRAVTGWFTEDFTLAELKTLRAVERLPDIRQRNTAYNGVWPIMTFQEVLDLAKRLGRKYHRTIPVFPETKHPTYFNSIGLPLEPPLVEIIKRNGLNRHDGRVVVQSFEPTSLQKVKRELRVVLWQAIGISGAPYDFISSGNPTTYADMVKPDYLRTTIAKYAEWIGPDKSWLVPLNPDGSIGQPTSLVRDTHAAGLKIGMYTFRNENTFLPLDFRRGTNPADFGDPLAEYRLHYSLDIDAVVTDFPDTAIVALDTMSDARRRTG